LSTAGIVDHDSVAGADEFIQAGRILRFPVTCGFELRVDFSETPFGAIRTNNPDQMGVSYMTFHGAPHTQFDAIAAFLKPVGEAREARNRAMIARLNGLVSGVTLDYDADVLPLSMRHDGGSVTERHLLYAYALRLVAWYGRGDALLERLSDIAPIPADLRAKLTDLDNPYFDYDLLGFLKAQAVERIYLPADSRECPPLSETVAFADRCGLIITYPYLGDIIQSVTGDKKAQTFEDGFLDELFVVLREKGVRAISYMPSRNTPEQLIRLRALCDRYETLQISGEDINSPRQSFVCAAMREPMFANLYDTTWALIGHETEATRDLSRGFMRTDGTLAEKITRYKALALEIVW
jgi:hypothetical protein